MAAAADGPLPFGDVVAVGLVAAAATAATSEVARHNKPQVHHIATDKNSVSQLRGGPWTPRFAPLFEKAGVSMNSWKNKTIVLGHGGPHPETYHRAIYDRLVNATAGKTGDEYAAAFTRQLHILQVEIATPGTKLNEMVTK